eukprot:5287-Heterococcus_DN1.PRE.1
MVIVACIIQLQSAVQHTIASIGQAASSSYHYSHPTELCSGTTRYVSCLDLLIALHGVAACGNLSMSASHLRAREPFCSVSSSSRSFHSAVEAGFLASCLAVISQHYTHELQSELQSDTVSVRQRVQTMFLLL